MGWDLLGSFKSYYLELGIYWVVLSVLIDKDLYTSISTKIFFGKGVVK